VETYILYRSKISSESESFEFLEEQMQIADKRLKELEHRQANFKEQKEIGSPDAQKTILLTRLADYEKTLTNVKTKRIGKEAKLAVIKEQLKDGINISIPSTESSDSPSREKYIAKLKGELLDMEIRREQLLQKFTPQYEEVINLDNQILATNAKIENEIKQIIEMEETSIRALSAEENVLQRSISKIKTELGKFAQTEFEYSQISRGIDDSREIYSMRLKQREEARISLDKLEREVKIKVVSPAITPMEPIRPKKRLNIAISAFLGILGGIVVAFLVDYFDQTLSTPEDIKKYTNVPLLGSIREIKQYSPQDKLMI
ncbi:GumC family protein, partial [Calditrichota bacterium]